MLEDEQELIQAAQHGDDQAFGRLYDHYIKAIYRFIAVKVGSKEQAEDLTHEVFLRAWQKLPSFKSRGFPFSSWLYRIARNRVIDHYRTQKSHLNVDDLVGQMEEEFLKVSSDQRQQLDLKLDLEKVMSALEQLTPDQREVMELRFIEDLSPKEIAEVIGKREGTVRILQHRATKKLQELLAEDDE
ncbi:MAG: RNA polymerase subunit sigma-24 [Candidatus Harrisonbacteria bacterium CG10_big_fil_rev_8_21_14_0_10_49_15]|uniref:RNA polymerase subunit sigma-24 n=1 Tax=Candidatus Harrisonbacteria bacterium CG10_big_fil_rev_8_21_14_0_10_49_15 TaxID=1974587 RepID=A0A2H0UK34_9BACT|nr:MAG: RNA polymerase subunit sigma-24 [Candidatus Harrisonbacteria bacterium CG10_big_fil_rev_8_21_14_0_10_49_15]